MLWERTVTSVLSPRHDGLSAETQLGLPERSSAYCGTLGRRATGQTEAVRRTKVGEWFTDTFIKGIPFFPHKTTL